MYIMELVPPEIPSPPSVLNSAASSCHALWKWESHRTVYVFACVSHYYEYRHQ